MTGAAGGLPNPKVDRKHRHTILAKRIRNIRKRLTRVELGKKVKLIKKLADYEGELSALKRVGG